MTLTFKPKNTYHRNCFFMMVGDQCSLEWDNQLGFFMMKTITQYEFEKLKLALSNALLDSDIAGNLFTLKDPFTECKNVRGFYNPHIDLYIIKYIDSEEAFCHHQFKTKKEAIDFVEDYFKMKCEYDEGKGKFIFGEPIEKEGVVS